MKLQLYPMQDFLLIFDAYLSRIRNIFWLLLSFLILLSQDYNFLRAMRHGHGRKLEQILDPPQCFEGMPFKHPAYVSAAEACPIKGTREPDPDNEGGYINYCNTGPPGNYDENDSRCGCTSKDLEILGARIEISGGCGSKACTPCEELQTGRLRLRIRNKTGTI